MGQEVCFEDLWWTSLLKKDKIPLHYEWSSLRVTAKGFKERGSESLLLRTLYLRRTYGSSVWLGLDLLPKCQKIFQSWQSEQKKYVAIGALRDQS